MLMMSMVGPLGVLAACPVAATTEAGNVNGRPPGLHGDNEVGSTKKMLVVTSESGGCWPRAPAACAEPQTRVIIIGLGQFSAALAGDLQAPSRQSESVTGAEHTCLGCRTKLSRL
jgi:hypothetical protein